MTTIVLDDHLLVLHLVGLDHWRRAQDAVATTASWWFRLARALERGGTGRLSTLLAAFDPADREPLERAIRRLPRSVRVPHPRDTIPVAAAMSAAHGLNVLAADALATAMVTRGRILVSFHDDGPRLRAAAHEAEIPYQAVEV